MYLIDTNIHAAFLLQNFEYDKLTRQYLKLFENITLADRVVPDFILGELETFIIRVIPPRYQLNSKDEHKLKELAFDYIHRLAFECTIVVPEIHTVLDARDLYFKYANTNYLSFIDCLILATAKSNKYTLLSKDTRLNTIAHQLDIPQLKPQ